MRGEREEPGVVNRLLAVIAGNHDFHVVVETGGAQTIEVFESADVFPDRGRKVLRLHEPHVLAPGVGQNVAEGMDTAPPFGREWDVVRRIIHLPLHSWTRLESPDRKFRRVRPEHTQPVPHDRVPPLETQSAKFFMQANRRYVGIAL
jgi:hypothetical protein